MDDPWANAWGEPSRPSLPHSATNTSTTSAASSDASLATSPSSASWAAPSVSVIQGDHEDDLSMPSWGSRPHAGWAEPDVPETSLWGADTLAGGWNPAPSSFDRMSLASRDSDARTPEPEVPPEPGHSLKDDEHVKSPVTPPLDPGGWKTASLDADAESPKPSPPSSPIVKVAPLSLPPVDDFGAGGWEPTPSLESEPSDEVLSLEKEASSPPSKARPISLVPPDDADGFGVFETAHEAEEEDGWGTPLRADFSAESGDPWATPAPWGAETLEDAQDGEDDEWEAARRQKAKQDLHVPPELLASILRQFEDLALDLWPDKDEQAGEPERRADFESIGLDSAISRLIPENLTLPQNVPFSKTFISKQVAEALRLTRHSACTRSSPMAFYMASKGSTSWEASLKSKPLVPQEDIAPAGWKIVVPEKDDSALTDDSKKKSGGGLLSFFQRKPTLPAASEESKPKDATATTTTTTSSSGTPRASVDSTRSSTAQSQTPAKSTPASPSVVSFASSLNPISETPAKPPTPSTMSDFSVTTDPIVRVATPPAPSAVSRFLGRFSGRARSSSRDSMALSTDDLEFLADVPTASSGDTISELDTDALSAMIRAPPLPTKLPAPLAPPPRAPPQPSRAFSPPPPPKTQPVPAAADDFMSFFDALPPTQSQASASALALASASASMDSPLSLLAPSPPPPQKKSERTQSLSSFQAFAAPPPAPSIAPAIPESRGFSLDQSTSSAANNDNDDLDAWPSFDYPSAPSSRPTPPVMKPTTPIQPVKRSFVPVMASSSSRPPSAPATPPLLPKPTSASAFAFPPPPSTQRPAANGASLMGSISRGSSPFPPPPSLSRVHTPLSIQPTPTPQPSMSVNVNVTANADDDDDDFADFLSSPAQANPPASESFQSFAAASTHAPAQLTNTMNTMNPTHTMNRSDSFDDFLDPIPPAPPAKSPRQPQPSTSTFGTKPSPSPIPALAPPPPMSGFKPPPPPITASSPPPAPSSSSSATNLSRKPSRKADHSRTLSLMESAAARGRWFAPPSPLPDALPPPSSSGPNGHAGVDFMGGGGDGDGDGDGGFGAFGGFAGGAGHAGVGSGSGFGAGMSSMQAAQAAATNAMYMSAGAVAQATGTVKAALETPAWTFPPPAGFNKGLSPSPIPPPAPAPTSSPFAAASLNPTNTNGTSSPFGLSLASTPTPSLSAPNASTGKGASSGKTGGLSAQDLSFFEGL